MSKRNNGFEVLMMGAAGVLLGLYLGERYYSAKWEKLQRLTLGKYNLTPETQKEDDPVDYEDYEDDFDAPKSKLDHVDFWRNLYHSEAEKVELLTKVTAPAPVPESQPNDSFPLKVGSIGQKVERLQVYLMRHFGWAGKPTGYFGEATLQRVQQFLQVDEVNEQTFEQYQMDKMVHDQRKP